MYENVTLPEVIEGKWIWHSSRGTRDCVRFIFKNDFSIFEMPSIAELWVASNAFFQIFINGRPCTAGPIPNPGAGNGAFAIRVDITHMVDVGINHIAITAHVENTDLAAFKRGTEGIWLQVNIDNKPVTWTDEQWICLRPECYIDTGLRTAPCDVFTEHVDLRNVIDGWMTRDVEDIIREQAEQSGNATDDGKNDMEQLPLWVPVDIIRAPTPSYGSLESFDQIPRTPEVIHFKQIPCRGTGRQTREATWVSFAAAIDYRDTLGTYVAESFIYSPPGDSVVALCVCDEPYMLFVNDKKVNAQAVPPLPMRSAPGKLRTGFPSPQEMTNPTTVMKLEAGWNQILLVQECHSTRSGFMFIWPDLSPGSLQVHQKAAFNSQPGWYIAGPITTPMALIYPTFPFDELVRYPFNPIEMPPNDISAFYLANSFKPETTDTKANLPLELAEKEYVVIDFGRTFYSYPHAKFSGNAGDVIDIICGESYQHGEVVAYEPGGRRNVSTVILREGNNEWMCSTPRGLRYIMLINRTAKYKVTINSVDLWQESKDVQNPGSFQCSSPIIDNIWNIGVNTLSATMQRVYMDSPTKDQAQHLTDAMIQSWAAYYVFGTYDKAGRAIESFAKSQFETGDMNAVSPSGLFQTLPDYSLAWPVWLQRHFLHTGDTAFLKKMMPTLQKLLYYYNEMAVSDDGPLDDMQKYLGIYAFLDNGEIDRQGISTGLNSLYCRALLSASWLAAQAQLPDLADVYKNRANNVAHMVWTLNWNEKKQLFADSYHDGQQSKKISWQSNVLSIYGGIAKPQHYQAIWDKLFMEEAPLERNAHGEFNNPFFKYFILESAFALGKSQWALRLIHYYWGRMAKAGATTWWELFDPDKPELAGRLCSHCQGSAVSPNCFIISELVGIRPAEPGMRMVYFNPMPGDVSWAKASIPTPHGYIFVHWKLLDDGTFNVTINSNYLLEVIPVLAPGIAKTAIFNVGDKVSILAQDND